ncbi:hypothetical protein LBMAG52_28700 [Planctomycetia bacterium]|nr:hypothetical protein LBMAG52_28700 [Planctomycetia bacterium]
MTSAETFGKFVPATMSLTLFCPAITWAAVAEGKSEPKMSLCSTPYSIAVMNRAYAPQVVAII